MVDAWCDVRVVSVSERESLEVRVGEGIEVTATVRLGVLSPSDVVVEAYSGVVSPDGGLRNGRGTALELIGGEDGAFTYRGAVPTRTSGLHGYSVRVMPRHDDVLVPNELPLIVWEES